MVRAEASDREWKAAPSGPSRTSPRRKSTASRDAVRASSSRPTPVRVPARVFRALPRTARAGPAGNARARRRPASTASRAVSSASSDRSRE